MNKFAMLDEVKIVFNENTKTQFGNKLTIDSDEWRYRGSHGYIVAVGATIAMVKILNNIISIYLECLEPIPTAKEFILPEKWCIRVKNEEDSTTTVKGLIIASFIQLGSWYREGFTLGVNYMYSDGTWSRELKKAGLYNHTEITFEQFEKYVLKKDTVIKENKTEILGKYYSITQIEAQLLKVYDKSDVKDIIKSIKTIK